MYDPHYRLKEVAFHIPVDAEVSAIIYGYDASSKMNHHTLDGLTTAYTYDGAAVYTPGISERRGSTTTFLHSGLKNVDAGKVIGDVLPIKPGASGGPAVGKPFPMNVKEQTKAENTLHGGSCICVFCHQITDIPQVDHAAPRSRGGDAQIACSHCNQPISNRAFPNNPLPRYVLPWPPPWFMQ